MAPFVPPFRRCTSSPSTTMRSSCSIRRSITPATASTNLRSAPCPVVLERVERRAASVELARVAADADVDEARGRATGRAGCGACRVVRDRSRAARPPRPHRLPAPARARAATSLASIRPSCVISVATRVERVALAPLRLLLLGAVAEGAAGVRAVLVEEAVDLGLDDRRAVAGAHALGGLLHRQVHGERIHAVDPPARDAEALAADREARVGGDLVDARSRRRRGCSR